MYDMFLFDTLPQQQSNMASYELAGRKVWLKKAAKRNSRLAYLPLTLMARWLNIEALKPVPNLGGQESVALEASRIKALSAAGIAVPTILAETPDALLLADAGSEDEPAATLLEKLTQAQTPGDIDQLLNLGISALNDVHERSCYLSEAFARNILVNKDGVVFIDFEYFGWDDPTKTISDFLLHPGMDLSHDMRQRFVCQVLNCIDASGRLTNRLAALYPLFGLKWCLILLNEFIPDSLHRLEFASGVAPDKSELQRAQLKKAVKLLGRVKEEYEAFPYFD